MARPTVTDASIDTSDLRAFAQRMATAADPNLNRQFGKALRTASLPVAVLARSLAPVLSGAKMQIGPTIKVAGGATRIVIVAGIKGSSIAPAKAFEGPQGFRHPVFGRWLAGQKIQSARPFLAPALAARAPAIAAESELAVQGVLREAGFE